jgi:hypothetical protein
MADPFSRLSQPTTPSVTLGPTVSAAAAPPSPSSPALVTTPSAFAAMALQHHKFLQQQQQQQSAQRSTRVPLTTTLAPAAELDNRFRDDAGNDDRAADGDDDDAAGLSRVSSGAGASASDERHLHSRHGSSRSLHSVQHQQQRRRSDAAAGPGAYAEGYSSGTALPPEGAVKVLDQGQLPQPQRHRPRAAAAPASAAAYDGDADVVSAIPVYDVSAASSAASSAAGAAAAAIAQSAASVAASASSSSVSGAPPPPTTATIAASAVAGGAYGTGAAAASRAMHDAGSLQAPPHPPQAPARATFEEIAESDARIARPFDVALEYNREMLTRYAGVLGLLALPLLYLTPVMGVLLTLPAAIIVYWTYNKARFQHGGDVRQCFNRDCCIIVGLVFISIALLLDVFNVAELALGSYDSDIDRALPTVVRSSSGSGFSSVVTVPGDPPPPPPPGGLTTSATAARAGAPPSGAADPDTLPPAAPAVYLHKKEASAHTKKLRRAEMACGLLVMLPALLTIRHLVRVKRLVSTPELVYPEVPSGGANDAPSGAIVVAVAGRHA